MKRKLIKTINEKYFRNYLNSNMNRPEVDNFKSLTDAAYFAFGVDDDEFAKEILDLTYMVHNNKISNFQSEMMVSFERKRYLNEVKIVKATNKVHPVLDEIMDILKVSEKSCLVGGAVRDTILGLEPKDFDFVTDINYDVLTDIFMAEGFQVKETGKEFLVMIVSKDGFDVEIANFRKDGMYKDGRRPEGVEIGTVDDDSQRRDFTINALYFNLSTQSIIDPTGYGLADIADLCLRFIGKPEDRIEEDALRVFRFYRFLKKLENFTADSKSLKAVRGSFTDAFKRTTPERARMEIEKMVGL